MPVDRSRLGRPDTNRSRVSIPSTLLERVEDRVDRSTFDSADAYVTYVLEEVLARVEATSDAETPDSIGEREIESRLRSLGYLD